MRNSQLFHELVVSESYTKDMEELQNPEHTMLNKIKWEEYSMKKSSKRLTAILGTATLAIGLMALPALAETNQQQGGTWFGTMHGYVQRTFSSEQHQTLMNSAEMQNLHNSQGMLGAMHTGDIEKMQELMNSNPAVKAHMGQENLDKMNEYMSSFGGNMMTNNSGMNGNRGSMMNGDF